MSSDGGSDDDVDMIDFDEKIKETRQKILADPYDPTHQYELLSLLRKNGDFEELAELRKTVVTTFPLTKQLWKEWLQDDISSDADRSTIEARFEEALFDSNSLELWAELVQWASGIGVEDPDFARSKFEDALAAIGLRVNEGSLIWMAYIDFEEVVPEPDEKKRTERLLSLYKRALRIPSTDLSEIWEKYKAFADEELDADAKSAYEVSAKAMKDLDLLETKLAQSDNSPDVFFEYLDYEIEKDDPARIMSMYERIVEAHPADESIWTSYGLWAETSFRVNMVTSRVYERAVRHCSWSFSLWQQLLLAMERSGSDVKKIDKAWKSAKKSITTVEDGRALFRTYIYLIRRRETAAGETHYPHTAKIFEEGEKFLREFGPDWDVQIQYRRNYAQFAFNRLHDHVKGRKIWEDILASGGGRMAERWLEAVRLERQFGDLQTARKMLYKALNSVSDHPNQIYEYIIQFEREEGTLEELDKALDKVNSQVMHRSSRPQKEHKEEKEKHGSKAKSGPKPNKRNDAKNKSPPKSGGNRKRAAFVDDADRPDGESPAKKHQAPSVANIGPVLTPVPAVIPQAPSPTKDKDGFTMPMLPARRMSRSPSPSAPASPGSAHSPGSSPMPMAVSFENKEIQEAADHHIKDEAAASARGGGEGKNKWTVFVSNLDFKCHQGKIEEVLDGVVEVRLPMRPGSTKLHKGYGFVELATEKDMQAALAKDRVLIDGRPMLISVNNPEKRTGFKYGTGLEKNKLFVRNIHYDCVESQIREAFEAYGKVEAVRIVMHKSGKSKGCAYVDMSTDEEAQKALDAEITLFERNLTVALSNPPKKGADRNELPPIPEGARKAKLMITPRAVTRRGAGSSVGKTNGATNGKAKPAGGSSGGKSNADFRAMLTGSK